MLRRPAIFAALLLVAAAFLLGLVRLFELRYERGDIYPPYSSLRTDPLGTSALYESLERLSGVTPRRYYEAQWQEEQGNERTLFVLGTRPYGLSWLPRAEFERLQNFVASGGRLVVGFYPEPVQTWSSRREEKELNEAREEAGKKLPPEESAEKQPESSPAKETPVFEDEDEDEQRQLVNLGKEWGFGPRFRRDSVNELEYGEPGEFAVVASQQTTNSALPSQLVVHTALYFDLHTNAWRTFYAHAELPVVVEREFGRGSVVLVADAYPFSNEAVQQERETGLLVWLLGSGREVWFEEAHLGVVEQPGISTLLRRYGLQGLIFSLLVVALLYVWQNASSLVPPHDETQNEVGPIVVGRDSASGFVNLLRRSISKPDILSACYAEWKKSRAGVAALTPTQLREVEAIINEQAALRPRDRSPVESYRAIAAGLSRRKRP
jgi:hypothetical protein